LNGNAGDFTKNCSLATRQNQSTGEALEISLMDVHQAETDTPVAFDT
jgi:hypothetical protein